MDRFNEALAPALDFVRREPALALAVAAGAYLLLLLLVLGLLVRQAQVGRRQRRLLRASDGGNLEQMLLAHADEMATLRAQVERASTAGDRNAAGLKETLQRVSVVRYDAFSDIGGRQSFSMAVLDAEGSGVVVSALHARNDMRLYAKPVMHGTSPLPLTAEEERAIATAQAGGPSFHDLDIPPARRERSPASVML
jgi:hypothetical protein